MIGNVLGSQFSTKSEDLERDTSFDVPLQVGMSNMVNIPMTKTVNLIWQTLNLIYLEANAYQSPGPATVYFKTQGKSQKGWKLILSSWHAAGHGVR